MIINSTTGIISWIPTSNGSFEVTVKVSDKNKSKNQSFTIVVEKTLFTSLIALPSTMEIATDGSKTIKSVTAHYDNGTETNIALTDCIYGSSNPNITVTNGTINISSSYSDKTAYITISYIDDGVTRSDLINIVAPYLYCGG